MKLGTSPTADTQWEIRLLGNQVENREGEYIGTVTKIAYGMADIVPPQRFGGMHGVWLSVPCCDIRIRGLNESFPEPHPKTRKIVMPTTAPTPVVEAKEKPEKKPRVPLNDDISMLCKGKSRDELIAMLADYTRDTIANVANRFRDMGNGQVAMQVRNRLRAGGAV